MHPFITLGSALTKSMQKAIKGGVYEEPYATCSKDCGGGKTVTCSGTQCVTTEKGCYSSDKDNPYNYKGC